MAQTNVEIILLKQLASCLAMPMLVIGQNGNLLYFNEPSDDRTGNGGGIPSGPQKHAVERYELSEDGRRLLIEYVIEDPEYLLSPTTGNNFWDYAPDREMLPFPCDPQNAALYGLG